VRVSEATHGERELPGHVYIAPGGRHLRVARSGANYVALLDDGPPVNRHRPSVEVLFRSAAEVAGRNAFGVMLTGMGKDGAQAMRDMRDAGAYNVAQDEATCVVYGMPKEAVTLGAVQHVMPLQAIAPHVLAQLGRTMHATRV
jgi:two-component system chemotaxis response regulator CheB